MNPAVVFDIKRFAVHDGDGIRTTVFFKGCPLRCLWCHNPEGLTGQPQLSYNQEQCISCGHCTTVCPTGAHSMEKVMGSKGDDPCMLRHVFDRTRCNACGACAESCFGHALRTYGKAMSTDELVPILLEDQEFYKQTGGGVTLSGGEPLLQADFCVELLKALKEHHIHTAVDTCGLVDKSAIEKVMPYTDIFLYDVKAIDDDLHRTLTGKGSGEILANLKYIDEVGKAIEIRIPFIPGGNDRDIENIGAFLGDFKHIVKVKLLPYHQYYVSKYEALGLVNTLPATKPPDAETMAEALGTLRKFGLNAVGGNE